MDDTLQKMLEAARKSFAEGGAKVKSCMTDALREEMKAFQDIAEARIRGEISEEDLESQLDDERRTLEASFLACRVESKVAIQNAANAAIEAFTDALKGVLP